MTVGSALSLSHLSMPPLKHSDSNWSLLAEFDFPQFVSEDGDWRDFGFLLENSDAESDAEPDLPDGIEPAGPEDPPCNEEAVWDEYELGMYAPKPIFDYDLDDMKNAENLDLQGVLYDDILDDDDYLPQADAKNEHLKKNHLMGDGYSDEIFIPKLHEEHNNNKDSRISRLYEPLRIEIPETAEPEEKAPMLCLANLRKRTGSMDKGVEEKKTKLANHNDSENKPTKDSSTEVEVPLVKRLRPRPARLTPMDLEVIRRDENGEITKKRVSQIGNIKAEPAQVVNPAEISLGGEVHDWIKDEKPSEMVTTKNLIKDEDDRGSIRSGRSGRFGGSNSILLRRRKNSSMASNQGPTTHPGWISPRKQKTDSSADEAQPTAGILMHVPPITPTRGRGRPRKCEMEKKKREELQRERILAEGTTANQTTLDPSQLHCVCRTPYDEKKFYVACNICSRWFHGKCVGISEKKAKRLSSFTCEVCVDRKMDVEDDKIDVETASSPTSEALLQEKEEPEEELYCLCRTPYDDTLFYVGCDGCEGWFHPKCVDITQEEAEMAAQYLCPSCTQNAHENDDNDGYESASSTNSDVHNTLSRADYPLVWSLLEMISEHRLAWPFKDPVDTLQFPTYLNVIKHPIDLSIIQNKLENLEYRRLRDFARDMLTMLDNARTFNIKGSEIYKCADTLEGVFRLNLADVKANIESRNKMGGRKVSESHTVDSSMDIDTDQLIDVDIDPSLFDQFL